MDKILENELLDQAMDMFVIPKKAWHNRHCFEDDELVNLPCIGIHPMEVKIAVPLPDTIYEKCELCSRQGRFFEVTFSHESQDNIKRLEKWRLIDLETCLFYEEYFGRYCEVHM